jgi:hypothetical protein
MLAFSSPSLFKPTNRTKQIYKYSRAFDKLMPATIGPPGLSPRPTELYIDCTAAKASAMPSPKQIIAQTYFTAVMMLPPLLTACCKLCLANGPDQAGARLRQCGELEFNQSEREGDDWLARMNESGRCIPGPAA